MIRQQERTAIVGPAVGENGYSDPAAGKRAIPARQQERTDILTRKERSCGKAGKRDSETMQTTEERQPYEMEAEQVLDSLGTTALGLTRKEAEERQKQYGSNELAKAEKETLLHRFLGELKDPMLILLMAAAGVSAVTNILSGESMTEVVIILAVVFLNAILGVVQESKAEQAIEALQTMTAATCKVIRDGCQQVIHSAELVPGDIVVLEAGDAVPADGRLLEAARLKIEESALTGESVPSDKRTGALPQAKTIPLGDRSNMCYMGSSVVYGRGKAVITGTGMSTEMGKIADVLNQTEDEQTPLQITLKELGKKLSVLVVLICIFIFAFNLLVSGDRSMTRILETFMIAVSLAVAAIPEGLATVVTVVLSIGVTKMSRQNAVIRKMTAVETLGCTQVICSDKTGTLTQNRMTVVETVGDPALTARCMALCSDAVLGEGDKAEGEPTEAALVAFALTQGLRKDEMEKETPRVDECPFDSLRKLMSTIHADGDGFVQYTKGAPDVVLSRCDFWWDGSSMQPMTSEKRREYMTANRQYADRALRVLAAAMRRWDEKPSCEKPETVEQELCFIGLTGMIDPIRPEVKAAISECRTAGIQPVMITGDHRDTAAAIARELGILQDSTQAVTGADLDDISDEEMVNAVSRYRVYARVQPEHKVRIVKAWKKRGAVTAMTGDGVNDAPSIKTADIGIGMGITGTDVTKNVADMILADDNFATIVKAVQEGRRIYDNIRKAIQFCLSSNMSEVIGVFAATVMGFTLFSPVHILFINLITDCFPALALGLEEGEAGIMNRPPRKTGESIFSGGMAGDIVYQAILVSGLTLLSYFIGFQLETGQFAIPKGVSPHGMTMAFLTMNMCEIFHSFNMRSRRASLFTMKKQNRVLWAAMAGSLVLVTAVIKVTPVAAMFGFTEVGLREFGISIGLALVVIPVVEIVKLAERSVERKKSAEKA